MVKYTPEELNFMFHALSDPTRREMVKRLTQENCTISKLAKPFKMSLPAVLKHIKVLEEAGMVKREKIGRENIIKINPEPLKEIMRYLSFYKEFWSNQFESIEDYLTQKQLELKDKTK